MARLDGKVAIITGATGGIGEATAKLYLSEGAKVMLVGRSAEKLSASLERVGHEDSVAHFVADAADEAATRDSVAATVEAFGGVDILFANAGTEGVAKPLEDLTFEEFNHVLQTNVIGVCNAAGAKAPAASLRRMISSTGTGPFDSIPGSSTRYEVYSVRMP